MNKAQDYLFIASVFLLGVVLYSPFAFGKFNDMEVIRFIYPFKFNLIEDTFRWIFIDSCIGDEAIRPFPSFLWLLFYKLFGAQPFCYYSLLLVVFSLNGALVYILTNRLLGMPSAGLLASAYFITHPVNHALLKSAIYYTDVLAMSFSILSICSYIAFRERNKQRIAPAIASISFFVLGVGCKESALVVPFILLVYELIYHRPAPRLLIGRSYLPLLLNFCLFFLYMMFRVQIIGGLGKDHDISDRLIDLEHVIRNLLWLLGVWYSDSWIWYLLLASLLIPLVPIFSAELRFFTAWIWLGMLPTLNMSAERYIYLSSVGLAALVAIGVIRLSKVIPGKRSWLQRTIKLAFLIIILLINISNDIMDEDIRRAFYIKGVANNIVDETLRVLPRVEPREHIHIIVADPGASRMLFSKRLKVSDKLIEGMIKLLKVRYGDDTLNIRIMPQRPKRLFKADHTIEVRSFEQF